MARGLISTTDPRHRCLSFLACALSPLATDDQTMAVLRDDLRRGAFPWESLVELASHHLVSPTLYCALADKGLLAELPAEVRDYFSAVHSLNGVRNRRIVDQTLEIAGALNATGVAPVALKGVAHLFAGLYPDPGARVIGDVDLLVPSRQLRAAVDALARIGYRPADLARIPEADVDAFFAVHHHHPPLVREDHPALVELHTEPLPQAFAGILSGERVTRHACRAMAAGCVLRLPSLRDQVVHHIAHTQLADRNHRSGRVSLRYLSDLARLRLHDDGAIDWGELQRTFARAGHGSACAAYLLIAERLLGHALPAAVRPTAGARFACRRVIAQARCSWLMALGEWYGYHRAILAELWAGRAQRRRVLTRLVHPDGYRRYLNALVAHIGRAG